MTSFLLLSLLLAQIPTAIQAQTGVVTGILRTDTGLPLQGVRVAVTPANPSVADSLLESQGLTDNTGRYRLETVSPGRYNILVGRTSESSYHPAVTELREATPIQVVSGSTIEVPAMVFVGAHVSGRVVDMETGEGRRIENLVLCCDYSQPVQYREGGQKTGSPFMATISNDGS